MGEIAYSYLVNVKKSTNRVLTYDIFKLVGFDAVEIVYMAYICPRGNLPYFRIYPITGYPINCFYGTTIVIPNLD